MRKSKLTAAESHQLKIALDTVRNPDKALLGGPTVAEAHKIIERLTGIREEDTDPFTSFKDSHGV